MGLLGGSFNPAHAGHLHIARIALARLRLQQVWLLVSPGNPLKPARGMAPLGQRLASAQGLADGCRIVATAIESALHTRFTVDTLRVLSQRFPRVKFIWLMGADNLVQLPRWRRWKKIVALMPFAVLARPTYNHRALASRAALCLRPARRPACSASILAATTAPSWAFLSVRQHYASATEIRRQAMGE